MQLYATHQSNILPFPRVHPRGLQVTISCRSTQYLTSSVDTNIENDKRERNVLGNIMTRTISRGGKIEQTPISDEKGKMNNCAHPNKDNQEDAKI